jgi:hypothetical protein
VGPSEIKGESESSSEDNNSEEEEATHTDNILFGLYEKYSNKGKKCSFIFNNLIGKINKKNVFFSKVKGDA